LVDVWSSVVWSSPRRAISQTLLWLACSTRVTTALCASFSFLIKFTVCAEASTYASDPTFLASNAPYAAFRRSSASAAGSSRGTVTPGARKSTNVSDSLSVRYTSGSGSVGRSGPPEKGFGAVADA
jgi:hypothetical protein